MEDGVLEIKDLVNREEEEEKQRVDAKEIEEEDQNPSGGVISNFISALVTKDNDEEENKQEEEKEGGIISHLISNLVSPLSLKVMKEDNVSTLGEEKKGGGVFDNLISGILHQSGGEKDEGNEKVETEANESKGLIDNIVSHLPTPLADDAVPATEEASILIHSIVHD
ncbi:hypothetical protein DH2020_015175 [Rehmannia glutinosa]|uniref:Uncharacterized protein n=1 Tax=Rehmannia glutinosa TaxID=99300 RepID=A0ABR0WZ86_REHGL